MDTIAISSVQTAKIIVLYKFWGVVGIDAKTFSIVFLKSLAPVIVSLSADYSVSSLYKIFVGIGTIVGNALDSIIAVTLYLSQYVYYSREITSKTGLEEDIQLFMQTDGFRKMIEDIKQ